jgi:hypothetical protein
MRVLMKKRKIKILSDKELVNNAVAKIEGIEHNQLLASFKKTIQKISQCNQNLDEA